MDSEILGVLKEIRDEAKATNARLAAVEDNTATANNRLASLENTTRETNKRLASLEDNTSETNKRLASLEGTTVETNKRLESLEGTTVETNKRLGSLEGTTVETNKRLGSLEGRFEFLEKRVSRGFEAVTERLDEHASRFVEMERHRLEIEMRLSTEAVAIHDVSRQILAALTRRGDDHELVLQHEARITAIEARLDQDPRQ